MNDNYTLGSGDNTSTVYAPRLHNGAYHKYWYTLVQLMDTGLDTGELNYCRPDSVIASRVGSGHDWAVLCMDMVDAGTLSALVLPVLPGAPMVQVTVHNLAGAEDGGAYATYRQS